MSDNRAIGYEKQTAEMNSPKGKNYFFGIGIDTYPEFRHLQNAVKDVNDIYNCLAADFDYESLGILANHQATRTAIIDGLRALRKNALLTENDKLLIYFAGHGKPDDNDWTKGFLIPYGGKKDSSTSLIRNEELRDIIQSISKPKHILLVCDCCFGGSLLMLSENNKANYTLEQNKLNRSRQIFCS